jgi:hypothetical protein
MLAPAHHDPPRCGQDTQTRGHLQPQVHIVQCFVSRALHAGRRLAAANPTPRGHCVLPAGAAQQGREHIYWPGNMLRQKPGRAPAAKPREISHLNRPSRAAPATQGLHGRRREPRTRTTATTRAIPDQKQTSTITSTITITMGPRPSGSRRARRWRGGAGRRKPPATHAILPPLGQNVRGARTNTTIVVHHRGTVRRGAAAAQADGRRLATRPHQRARWCGSVS